MIYNYPRSKFVDEVGLYDQLKHVESEVVEVFEAYHQPDIDLLAGELMDVIHSCETALRKLQETRGVNVNKARRDCERKNSDRFYYHQEAFNEEL